ncbi:MULTISPECIES: TetR/AcrR family transcriptional regulator [unclassified Variovorax]|jgi:TetR/AcrR family transcriptional regulator|uniref:TetR/AcrR family transcriptional regulator n=1 Tax=unclassified Variovorax TaxID=663243 RepID=UPI000F7F313D|nr:MULTISPECIES: TetR/AcrR family transcriptional regulator [unclassified Variovorax]RSZ39738.1 TetR/AcrR family transcriptional regulator [Variovorax sp. 553]RSZ40555.1 TetR/AcrR family transcriptional regulator [Variovorax sp. 679]
MTVDPFSSRPSDQRSLIAKSAAELFARKGYAATSMNEIAEASHLSKPGLYHHFKDKAEVLLHIADGHVSRLVDIVTGVEALQLAPDERLPELIEAFMAEYAQAQHEHRVLTEDVRFLAPDAQARVLDKERTVVRVFADAIAAARPDLHDAQLHKLLTMFLFGMLNWMFTWFKAGGRFSYEQMSPIATQLFLNGISGLEVAPKKRVRKARKS